VQNICLYKWGHIFLFQFGATPLILAASAGKEEAIKALLKHKASVNAKNKQGHSALQLSASKGWKSVR
jgi:ankyrin repeat protein